MPKRPTVVPASRPGLLPDNSCASRAALKWPCTPKIRKDVMWDTPYRIPLSHAGGREQRREEGCTSSKRARDKKDSTQSLLERPDVTSFAAAVCLAHRMNPPHHSVRVLERVVSRNNKSERLPYVV